MKRALPALIIILIMILVPFTLISKEDYDKYLDNYGYSQDEDDNSKVDDVVDDTLFKDDAQDEDDTANDADDADDKENTDAPVYSLVRDSLTEKQLSLYDEILKQVKAFKESCTAASENKDDVTKAYEAVGKDYPEYMWAGASYKWVSREDAESGMFTVTITQNTGFTMEELKAMHGEAIKKADEIIALAQEKETVYDKILFIHDYLAEKVSYDFDTVKYMEAHPESTELLLSSTVYNALLKDTAICSGYSAAYQLLLNRLGVSCGRISGKSLDSGDKHEWNYVMIDKTWSYVDVTWDSPASDEPGAKKADYTHDYFCITEEELLLTHSINKGEVKPVCNSTEYDYFKRSGAYFESYDRDEVSEYLIDKKADGNATVKFANKAEADAAEKDLITDKNIWEIMDLNGKILWRRSSSKLALFIDFDGEDS